MNNMEFIYLHIIIMVFNNMVGINRDCIIYQIIDQLKKCQIKVENNIGNLVK